MRKPAFCIYAKTKMQIRFAVTAKLISVFVFATRIIRVGYRLQKQYRCTLLHTAVYRNSIKLTLIVNLSAAMGIHLIDMPTSHGVLA